MMLSEMFQGFRDYCNSQQSPSGDTFLIAQPYTQQATLEDAHDV